VAGFRLRYFSEKRDQKNFQRAAKRIYSRATRGSLPLFMRDQRRAQRSAVKISYKRNLRGAWRAHAYYLSRTGSEKKGERTLAFSKDREGISLPERVSLWEKARDKRMFKLILSPEKGGSLELRKHTREVMKKVEESLGRGTEWLAVVHTDTDNPHVHICLRGRDVEGKELRLPRELITGGIRSFSSEAITRLFGLKREKEIQRDREREVTARRFTGIDAELLFRASEKHLVTERGDKARLQRLSVLENLGLAKKVSKESFQLAENLREKLRELGAQGDIIKTRARKNSSERRGS